MSDRYITYNFFVKNLKELELSRTEVTDLTKISAVAKSVFDSVKMESRCGWTTPMYYVRHVSQQPQQATGGIELTDQGGVYGPRVLSVPQS